MEQLSNLKSYVRESIKKYPQHEEEIKSTYFLCLDEIEEGGSVENEISLCYRDIDELIKS